jgi:hypothetical protein
MLPINRHPAVRELRAFARLWLPLFVAVLGGVIWWRTGWLAGAIVAWSVGAVLVGAVLASREIARIVFVGLLTITYPIGMVVSSIVLAFMFYAVFTPFGFLMRLGVRDALRLKRRDAVSHWTPYKQSDEPEQAFRQY